MANQYTDAVHKAILPEALGNLRLLCKAILTAMAWHTDNKSGVLWGSYGTFAREANCSRISAKRAVPLLVNLGLVDIIGTRATRNGLIYIFKFNLVAVVALAYRPTGLLKIPLPGPSGYQEGALEDTTTRLLKIPRTSSLNSSLETLPLTRPASKADERQKVSKAELKTNSNPLELESLPDFDKEYEAKLEAEVEEHYADAAFVMEED
jgi:hypothetical protein